jgi:hypothetical protein
VLLEGGRRRDDLEGRTRFVEILDGPVATVGLVCGREGIGVERRPVGEREDFAGRRRHDEGGAA